jgi:hypothetical protein
MRFLICWLVTVALTAGGGALTELGAQPARTAPLWLVPVDATQGLMLNRGSPVPFTGSVRFQVARGFGEGGRFRIGPSAALLYENPDWEVAAGLRASLRAFSLDIPVLTKWGVYLQAEQLYGTGDVVPTSLAVLTDLGILRFGLMGSHDWRREVQTVEASIGIGLDALIPLLRPTRPQEPDFGPPPPHAETRP